MKYAICKECNLEMKPDNGCKCSTIICNGTKFERIKAGDNEDFIPDMEENEYCHDCNVGIGQYHHFGCDAERCPSCGEQLIGCDCEIEYKSI